MFAIKEKKKWEAWTNIKGLDMKEAREKFKEMAKQLLDGNAK